MAVVDSAAPGEAPASSAAAGLLDPLSVKGRLMWQGEAALSAALRLIRAADANAGAGAEASDQCGILHAPHSTKHAEQARLDPHPHPRPHPSPLEQLRRAADEHAHALAGEHATGAPAAGVLAGCRWLRAEEAEAVAPGIRLPQGKPSP